MLFSANLSLFPLLLCGVMFGLSLSSSSRAAENPLSDSALIPRVQNLQTLPGLFTLRCDTRILLGSGQDPFFPVGCYLSDLLGPPTGFPFPVLHAPASDKAENAVIFTSNHADPSLGREGYRLVITENQIRIVAGEPAGAFYAVQTLRQLLPTAIESRTKLPGGSWIVPCLEITDCPRFPWRGMLLDSARHFLTKDFVKRYIDLLAMHKMNILHWHLTDDQAWTVEIKQYPLLTEKGAFRSSGENRHGGFYTQDDIREIVAYAKDRFVTIVPEIEMPGHAMAALACFPELSCTAGPFEVATRPGIFEDVFCAGNDKVFEFLQNVLTEVFELFPSPYIHIGGDECPKVRWKACPKCQGRIQSEKLKNEEELQSWFIKRMETFIVSKNKKLIGWDEILEGGLAPSATVQSWRGLDGAVAAASQGHDVVCSPTSHCYIDYDYETTSLEKIYSFEPVPPSLTPEQAKHILGGECNMWTDRTPQEQIDLFAFPRAAALAEVLWSPAALRNWENFQSRWNGHAIRMDRLGVHYYTPCKTVRIAEWKPGQLAASPQTISVDFQKHLSMITPDKRLNMVFYYRQGNHAVRIQKIELLQNGQSLESVSPQTIIGWPNPLAFCTLNAKSLLPDQSLQLAITLESLGGTDSWCSLWLSELASPADIR